MNKVEGLQELTGTISSVTRTISEDENKKLPKKIK